MPDPADAHAALAYETWATAAAIDSLETVPDAARASGEFVRACQVIAHLQLARRVWLARIRGRLDKPDDWFPAWSIDDLRRAAAEIDRAWGEYLTALTPGELAREIRYTSSEGVSYASLVREIIAHVFNHSTYHRGQVARLVTQAGGRRATTDMIAFTRRRV